MASPSLNVPYNREARHVRALSFTEEIVMSQPFTNEELAYRIQLCMETLRRTTDPKVIETQSREIATYRELIQRRNQG